MGNPNPGKQGPLHRVDLPHIEHHASRDAAWAATVAVADTVDDAV
jgi:hypothetical protein